jgi:hypothetical protein
VLSSPTHPPFISVPFYMYSRPMQPTHPLQAPPSPPYAFKVRRAQSAGAIAALISNHQSSPSVHTMGWKATVKAAAAAAEYTAGGGEAGGRGDTGGGGGPAGGAPGIPSVMISRQDGLALEAALQAGGVLSIRVFESPHCRRFEGGHREARAAEARAAQGAAEARAEAATAGAVGEVGGGGKVAAAGDVGSGAGTAVSAKGGSGVQSAPRAAPERAPATETLLPSPARPHWTGRYVGSGAIIDPSRSGVTGERGAIWGPARQAPLPPVYPWPLYVPVTQPVSFAWPEKNGHTLEGRAAGGGVGEVDVYLPTLGEVPPAEVQRAAFL